MAHLSAAPLGVLGVGIDLADPHRIRAALHRRPRLGSRIFTGDEQRRIERGELDPAAAFAAKEAVMKALGVGLAGVALADIAVTTGDTDQVVLSGRAAARAEALGISAWTVVIGREADLVRATAVARGRARRRGRTRNEGGGVEALG